MFEYPKTLNLFKRSEFTHCLLPVFAHPAFAGVGRWRATEKLDGTNCQLDLTFRGPRTDAESLVGFVFRGRTDKSQFSADVLQRGEQWAGNAFVALTPTADRFGARKLTLFGELVGGRIQGRHLYGHATPQFYLFDLLVTTDTHPPFWFDTENLSLAAYLAGLPTVPACPPLSSYEAVDQAIATPGSALHAATPREGLVLVAEGLYHRDGARVKCKVKHRDFASLAPSDLQTIRDLVQ